MPSRLVLSSLIFLLLMVTLSLGQSGQHDPLLARISYHNGFVQDAGEQSPSICFAVYGSGFYRLLRAEPMKREDSPTPPVLQGTLSKQELRRFTTMLRDLRFQSLEGGVVLGGSESFVAEVVQQGRPKPYIWINADHHDPFPNSIATLVGWLQEFQPRNATSITLHELSSISICPPMNAKPVQPVVAALQPQSDGYSCGTEPQH